MFKSKKQRNIALVLAANFLLLMFVIFLPKTPTEARKALSSTELEINQAVALVRGDSPMEGITRLKALEAKMPNNPELNYHLGVFSAVTQQYVKAIPRLEIAVKNERFEEAYTYLCEAYISIGNQKAADELIARAKKGEFSRETNESIIELEVNTTH